MNPKILLSILGLVLFVVVGVLGWATYTDRIAVVSTKQYSVQVKTGPYSIDSVDCERTKYRTLDTETQVIEGRSSGLPESAGGGALLKYVSNRPLEANPIRAIMTQTWGVRGFHGRVVSSGSNWVTNTCLGTESNYPPHR